MFCKSRPPSGCLQYHTGVSGTFESFDFANQEQFEDIAYSICFRQEEGEFDMDMRYMHLASFQQCLVT